MDLLYEGKNRELALLARHGKLSCKKGIGVELPCTSFNKQQALHTKASNQNTNISNVSRIDPLANHTDPPLSHHPNPHPVFEPRTACFCAFGDAPVILKHKKRLALQA